MSITSDRTPGAVDSDSIDRSGSVGPSARERQGRRWLIWSFVFCPCHLPLSMAVLAAVFGGTAFGALISANTLVVGLAFGLVYAIGVVVGLGHIRAATAGRDCSTGSCELP